MVQNNNDSKAKKDEFSKWVNDYEKRQEKMQKEAEKVGLGGLNKLADYAINIGESANILKRIKNIGAKYTKLR